MRLQVLALIFFYLTGTAYGHGFLAEPPGRASAWRYGFNTPVDYDDNECFCGGFTYQYASMGGKCGICGDPWDQNPRDHEVGGIYATGTIVRDYTQGQVIKTTGNVTTNHLGHFEYKICANNDVTVEATQDCLDL
ncbi:Cellulose/chitin-binding protein N-terminal [Trinorchestia longiramus]|nr:Cellulose/chitin-binding protein N-terminal [Trinorchestia longiramus]